MFASAAVLAASLGAAYAASDRPEANAEEGVVNAAEVTIDVKAVNYAFEPATVVVKSGDTVTLKMLNEDGGIDHNIEVSKLFTTPECNGPCTLTAKFTAPAPGEYQLFCITHPDMVGTLKVE
jgi:cytochrome c oxidase subunit 2